MSALVEELREALNHAAAQWLDSITNAGELFVVVHADVNIASMAEGVRLTGLVVQVEVRT